MSEKISVLIAVYEKDDEQNLICALDSVIGQTYPPEEILIMQDGPVGEGITYILEDYKKKYPELISHIINKENVGLGLTLARGVTECRNELIARMDADDIACPERLEIQVKEFMNDKELALLGGYIEEFETDPELISAKRLVPLQMDEIYKRVRTRNPFNHVTVMYRKSAVLAAGNYANLRNMQDYDLWIKMIHRGCKMKNVPYTLVLVRTGNGMFNRRGGKNYIELEKEIQQQLLGYKMINKLEYWRNLTLRVMVRKLGYRERRYIYMHFLRKGQ